MAFAPPLARDTGHAQPPGVLLSRWTQRDRYSAPCSIPLQTQVHAQRQGPIPPKVLKAACCSLEWYGGKRPRRFKMYDSVD